MWIQFAFHTRRLEEDSVGKFLCKPHAKQERACMARALGLVSEQALHRLVGAKSEDGAY